MLYNFTCIFNSELHTRIDVCKLFTWDLEYKYFYTGSPSLDSAPARVCNWSWSFCDNRLPGWLWRVIRCCYYRKGRSTWKTSMTSWKRHCLYCQPWYSCLWHRWWRQFLILRDIDAIFGVSTWINYVTMFLFYIYLHMLTLTLIKLNSMKCEI